MAESKEKKWEDMTTGERFVGGLGLAVIFILVASFAVVMLRWAWTLGGTL